MLWRSLWRSLWRTPLSLADFIQPRVCNLICEKFLTLPAEPIYIIKGNNGFIH